MMESVQLTKATADDIAWIEDFLNERSIIIKNIPNILQYLTVLKTTAGIIGIGGMEPYGDKGLGYIEIIDPDSRRQGYGKALVHKLINEAKMYKLKELYFLIYSSLQFFQELGFRLIPIEDVPMVIRNTGFYQKFLREQSITLILEL
jgi:amino-acid N-acetyltransferase